MMVTQLYILRVYADNLDDSNFNTATQSEKRVAINQTEINFEKSKSK